MSLFTAGVRKINGEGEVSVTIEVVRGSEFHMKYEPLSPSGVRSTDGHVIEPGPMCLSGARYARRIFPLDQSTVLIRGATGTIGAQDGQSLAFATVLAIGRALGMEDSIPERAFEGATGKWEPYS